MDSSCLVIIIQSNGVTGGGAAPLVAFTWLTKQSYRADEDKHIKKKGKEGRRKEGRREKKKDKRACAKAGQEHATLTTVRLGAYYSDYGALGSILQ